MCTILQRVVVGAVILTLAGELAACGGDNTTAGTAGNQPTGEAIVIGNVGNTSVRGPKIRDFAISRGSTTRGSTSSFRVAPSALPAGQRVRMCSRHSIRQGPRTRAIPRVIPASL